MNTEENNNTVAKKPYSDIAKAFMVMGIIGTVLLIASLLFPNPNSERTGAPFISCASNLKQIGLAIRMYSEENKGQYPDKNGAEGFEMLRAGGYLETTKMYTCPCTNTVAKDGIKLADDHVDYAYIGGYDESTPSDIAIAYDKPTNHHKHGNILFADGHVQGYAGANWMDNIKK